MLAKVWKKLGFFILIIACLFNIMDKLVHKVSFDVQLKATADYFQNLIVPENTTNANTTNSQAVQNYTTMQ